MGFESERGNLTARLLPIWDILTSSYWFVPSIMVAGSTCLAFVVLAVDQRILSNGPKLGWFYSGGAEGREASFRSQKRDITE